MFDKELEEPNKVTPTVLTVLIVIVTSVTAFLGGYLLHPLMLIPIAVLGICSGRLISDLWNYFYHDPLFRQQSQKWLDDEKMILEQLGWRKQQEGETNV